MNVMPDTLTPTVHLVEADGILRTARNRVITGAYARCGQLVTPEEIPIGGSLVTCAACARLSQVDDQHLTDLRSPRR